MKYVPLFIKCRRLIMTVGVQKSNEWIENRLSCTDNKASQSLCNNNVLFLLVIKGELYRAKPMLLQCSGKGK